MSIQEFAQLASVFRGSEAYLIGALVLCIFAGDLVAGRKRR